MECLRFSFHWAFCDDYLTTVTRSNLDSVILFGVGVIYGFLDGYESFICVRVPDCQVAREENLEGYPLGG